MTSGAPGAGVLRVGVNLCWVVPGVVGGSEDLLVGWLAALAEHPDVGPGRAVEVTVFGSRALAAAHPLLPGAFRYVPAPVEGRLKGLRVVTESTWLAAQTRRRRLDVVHQAGGVVPPVHPGRNALTVHDIQPLDLPANFSLLKRCYLGAMLPRSVRAADVLIATSRFVLDRLVDRLGAAPERGHVVPPVLRPAAHRHADAAADPAVRAVLARHRLHRPYVLYPAVGYPHKNHRVLVEAMHLLATGPAPPDVHLVLTGGPGPGDDELAATIARLGLGERVHRLGRVPQPDYEALLAGAAALVFPSRYEGFGLGAFDALAAGTPVVGADIAPLREVLGPDAALVGPDDAAGWAARIAELAVDRPARAAAAARSVAQAQRFSAGRSADALLGAYRAALGDPPAAAHGVRSAAEPPHRPGTPHPPGPPDRAAPPHLS